MDSRCVALHYINTKGQFSCSWFCFPVSAEKYAREEGATQWAVSIHGRVISAQGVSNAPAFMKRAA